MTMILRAIVIALICTPAMAQNFLIADRGKPELEKRLIARAEECRRDIALAWFGEELPKWSDKCAITWAVTKGPARGETRFYPGEQPIEPKMQVYGTEQQLMLDVIPHEVTHLIMHDWLGFTVPKWADEGMATVSESDELITIHEDNLKVYFQEGRVTHLSQVLQPTLPPGASAANWYPGDVLPFYAQGSSLARYLINLEGAKRFLEFLKGHNESGDWVSGVKGYGFADVDDLNTRWRRWTEAGCPDLSVTVAKPIPRSQAPYRPNSSIGDTPQTRMQPLDATSAIDAFDKFKVTPVGNNCGDCQIVIRREDIADAVDKIINQDPDRFKGDPGDPGEDGDDGTGTDGTTPTDEQIVALIKKHLPDIEDTDTQRTDDEIIAIVLQVLGKQTKPVADSYSLQPSVWDDNGNLVPFGDPIAIHPNKENLLPPMGIETEDVNGNPSYTQAPLGGFGRLKMGGSKESKGKGKWFE